MADVIEIVQGTATVVEVAGPTGPQGPAGAAGATGATGPQGVPGTGLEVLTTQGDLLYQGASTGQRLPIGTTGQVLKVSGGIPAWANESGAVTSVNGATGAVTVAAVSHAASHAAAGSDPVFDQDLNTGASVTFNEVTTDNNLTVGGDLIVNNAANIGDNGISFTSSGAAATIGYLGLGDAATANLDALPETLRIVGGIDATKKLAFEVDGITTGTTRTLTVPDSNGTIALTEQAADIEITDATKGVILKSPNNTRWRLTINDNGTLQRVALSLIAFLCMTASALTQNVTDVVANTNGVLVAPTNFFTANLQQWVTGSYVYAPTNSFSVTNSATLTNIPGGSFTVSANTSYIYIASAYLAGSNGYHLAIELPSIANAVVTNTASSGLYVITAGAVTQTIYNTTNNIRILQRNAAQTTNNPSFAIGTFRIGATGGTANLQFSQGVSSANPSEITTQTRLLIFPLP